MREAAGPRCALSSGLTAVRRSLVAHRRQRGQGLVEFALVVVFLVVLVGGAVQLGLMYMVHLTLRDASQEGAAYASVDPTNTPEIQRRVRDALAGTVDPASVMVTVTETNPGMFCAAIDPVTLDSNGIRVEASYNLQIIVPFLGALVGGETLPLRAAADDTILSPPC